MADKTSNRNGFSFLSDPRPTPFAAQTLDMFRANADELCRVPAKTPKQPQVTATISAAPEPSFSDAFDRARQGHTPMQKMDLFFATLRDVGISKARGWLFTEEVDKALTTMPAGVMKPIAYALSGDWRRPGDQQFSEKLAEDIDKYWDGAGAKPAKFGEYDIAMAVGWHPKEPIKINGVVRKLDKPIDNLLAVFVRNPDGSVEILDPSVKARGPGEALGKFVVGMPLRLDDSYTDRKWAQTAGTYVAWQVLPMLASAGAGTGLKALGTATKSEQVMALTETMNRVSKLGTAAGAAQMGAAGANIAGVFHQKAVSETAVDNLVKGLVQSLRDPSKITTDSIRDVLNTGLHQHTFNKNTGNSIYVPSLADGTSPWTRLSQVLRGRVDGFTKTNSPFDEWKRERDIKVPDITQKLEKSPEFMSAYYATAVKALSGQQLTDQEILLNRIGKAVTLHAFQGIEGRNFSKGELKFDSDERTQTTDYLRKILRRNLIEDIDNHPAIAKSLGEDLKKLQPDGKDESAAIAYRIKIQEELPQHIDDKILSTYVAKMKGQADAQIAAAKQKQLEQDRTRSIGASMAFIPH